MGEGVCGKDGGKHDGNCSLMIHTLILMEKISLKHQILLHLFTVISSSLPLFRLKFPNGFMCFLFHFLSLPPYTHFFLNLEYYSWNFYSFLSLSHFIFSLSLNIFYIVFVSSSILLTNENDVLFIFSKRNIC